MSFLFLVPLVVGLVTTYASQKAVDDLAEIFDAASLLNLFLSIILAPWQLHLLLLLLMIRQQSLQFWLPFMRKVGD